MPRRGVDPERIVLDGQDGERVRRAFRLGARLLEGLAQRALPVGGHGRASHVKARSERSFRQCRTVGTQAPARQRQTVLGATRSAIATFLVPGIERRIRTASARRPVWITTGAGFGFGRCRITSSRRALAAARAGRMTACPALMVALFCDALSLPEQLSPRPVAARRWHVGPSVSPPRLRSVPQAPSASWIAGRRSARR